MPAMQIVLTGRSWNPCLCIAVPDRNRKSVPWRMEAQVDHLFNPMVTFLVTVAQKSKGQPMSDWP
jgi:hypothetical protein